MHVQHLSYIDCACSKSHSYETLAKLDHKNQLFSSYLTKAYVLCTQKNHLTETVIVSTLTEMVLLSTHNIK